ncbi:hypothetical protein [Salinarchaeum sp. Harcht-Bsk1]|nr:hypothetical protein [Salinarchaeum sp. Harcht-Bsk1]
MRARTKIGTLVLLAIAVPAALAVWVDEDRPAPELPDDENWS